MTFSTTTTTTVSSDAYTNICPDGHACDNDASCVESLLQENKYVCDCTDAYEQTGRVYAGLSCQHVATAYCTTSGEISQTSYCVNEGVCNSKVAPTASHPGCKCPKNYTGEHCQFIVGSAPAETSYFLDGTTYAAAHYVNTEGPGVNPAAIVLPILFVTMGAMGYFLWKYRGFSLSGGLVVDKSKKADENMLEADGTSLSTSMSKLAGVGGPKGITPGRRMSTPAFSSTHKAALMDPPDFEDLLEQSDHVAFHMDPTGTAVHKFFASDPTLNFIPTTSTSGSGESFPTSYSDNANGTNYTENYDLSQNQMFEEYDPKDFTNQDLENIDTAMNPLAVDPSNLPSPS